MNGDEWIGAEEAGRILRVSPRMVYRYGQGEAPKLRTMRAGRRILFSHADVLAYANELGAENKPSTQTDIVRADELMLLVREQQAKLEAAARTIGDLEAQLRLRLLPADADHLKEQVNDLERERDRLRWENERLQAELEASKQTAAPPEQRHWLRRIFGS
jgi:hypothetical protein